MRIGLIGLGFIGAAVARRLVGRGHHVHGFDVAVAKLEVVRDFGIVPHASVGSLTEACDIILLALPTTDAVNHVVLSADGMLARARPNTMVIDLSTIDIATSVSLAGRMHQAGFSWLDAPVSGGPEGAERGELVIMSGAREEDFALARPVLEELGTNVSHVGGPGSGLVVKFLNQLIGGSTHVVLAEALRFAEAFGINAAQLPAVFAGGYADSVILQRLFPRMVERDFTPRGYAHQMLKDLELVSAAATGKDLPQPMLSAALSMYRLTVSHGWGALDSTVVAKAFGRSAEAR